MSTDSVASKEGQRATLRVWFSVSLTYISFGVILFVSAEDIGWWQAWVYSMMLFLAGIVPRYLAEKRHPGFLAERLSSTKGTEAKPWDKVLAPLMAVSFSFALVIVAGLDHRFGTSVNFPLWIEIFGFVLIAIGYGFASWALVENQFFSSTVHIQTEHAHTVCDSGPYAVVRHPGYAGNLLAVVGIIMALESFWTVIPSAVALIITVIRTSLEDRTLQEELEGYKAYAARVPFRLIPGIF